MTQRASWQNADLVSAYLHGIRGGIPLAQEQVDVMLRLIGEAGVPVRRILDLGCGDGFLGAVLLERYAEVSATFVDYSAPMLDAARERLASFGERATIAQADLASSAWREALDGSHYDAIVSGFAIHHLTDGRKRELYAELLDLLTPGAFFINIEHVSSATPWLEHIFNETLIDAFYDHQRAAGNDVTRDDVATEYVHRPDKEENILASVEAQCEWLRAIGYQDVDCYLKLLELAVFGGRRAG